MMSTWHSMWLDNNKICDVLQDLICVPDVFISVMMCTWLHFSVYMNFSNRKINCILQCLKQKQFERNRLYMQLVSEIKDLILAIFSNHTLYVLYVGDCISCYRLELAFLYHEKLSSTYVLSVEYMSN